MKNIHSSALLTPVFVIGFALTTACGEGTTGTAPEGGLPQSPGGSTSITYTLSNVTDVSQSIAEPHDILVYDAKTGLPLDPPLVAQSKPGTGEFTVEVPAGVTPAFYAVGNGTSPDEFYDTITVLPVEVNDRRPLMSLIGTQEVVYGTAMIEPRQDAAAFAGTIYWTPGGERKGVVGCAKVYLDDDTTGLNEANSQRYVGKNGLPVPAEARSETIYSQGSFYFGNLSQGPHTLRVRLRNSDVDLGGVHEIFVPHTRGDAVGPAKLMFLLQGIDLDLPENPTPADCPVE